MPPTCPPKCASACKRMGLALRSTNSSTLSIGFNSIYETENIFLFSIRMCIGEYASMKLWTLFEVPGICWATRIENLRFCARWQKKSSPSWHYCDSLHLKRLLNLFRMHKLIMQRMLSHTENTLFRSFFVRLREFSAFRRPFECKKNNRKKFKSEIGHR